MTELGGPPAPDPGEIGRTVLTDVLVGESDHVRILARQAVAFRSCVVLRLELIRAPGSSTEMWWEESRAATRTRNITTEATDASPSEGFVIELLEGTRLLAREGARGDEDRLVIDYALERMAGSRSCVLRVRWPVFGIEGALLRIPDLPPE
jgi:hypothetical protein